ncbi:MAG TPA: hypothetical protein VIX17_30125 [Pyrinomonadaceae bacterium]|jgi:hypothetical protein
MEKIAEDTGFLFAEPSFLTGFASVIDIGGSMLTYNVSRTGAEADQRAIASDWAVIGSDILNAAKTLGEKEPKAKAQTTK